jgi:hypothetical protein
MIPKIRYAPSALGGDNSNVTSPSSVPIESYIESAKTRPMKIAIRKELILHGNFGYFPPYLHASFESWVGIATVLENATMPAINVVWIDDDQNG